MECILLWIRSILEVKITTLEELYVEESRIPRGRSDKYDEVISQSIRDSVIQFLQELEQFGIKFSKNQRSILTSDTNTLVLGRSGTGKTTVSAFKIIALDLITMVFNKYKLNNNNITKLNAKDLEDFTRCRTVFCTASPVLTNEVKRFYKDLISCIKKVLNKKEASKAKSSGVIEESTSDNDKKLRDGIIETLQRAKQDVIEDLEMEKQMVRYGSLNKVPKQNFPLFLTVKKLVYMLDGGCRTSFFSRDKDSNIIGMDSSNEWHNENKEGALMINQYQKESFDFDNTIKEVGKEMIQAEDMDDEQKIKFLQSQGIDIKDEEIDAFMAMKEPSFKKRKSKNMTSEEYLKQKNQEKGTKKSKLSINQQMFSREVDFEMFESRFYNKHKGSLKLSALKVWTEIYSVIKGGLNSLMSIKYYQADILEYREYCEIKSTIDNFESPEEKYKLYLIYLQYEKWKARNNLYDFMDVVRHIFYNSNLNLNQKIKYLVIDEVQDLAPLTIQLLLLTTSENIFFCGDTAQTIAKGVAFRFHDLKPVFINQRKASNFYQRLVSSEEEKMLKAMKLEKYSQTPKLTKEEKAKIEQKALKAYEPRVVQLTKNYRSHNKILQLANSVIDIVELYFPQTIDKLQRERSEFDGPKPIILEGFDHDDLEKLMMASSQSSNPSFGCNQVVIVKSQDMKSKLPFFMKKALCLTVYEAKGLEFDDVILYDFFSESQCKGPWRIIGDIECSKETVQKVKIQENLTINELDSKEYNKLITRLKNEESKDDSIEYEEISVLKSDKKLKEMDRKYGILNVELKYLYVSITRPKTNLIIYDSDPTNRAPMTHYWDSQGLIDIVKKGQEKDHPVLSKAFEITEDEEVIKEKWRALGIKLLKKKYYDSAKKCFSESGDKDLEIRSQAYWDADEANNLLSESETLLFQAKNDKLLTKFKKRTMKKQGKDYKKEALKRFRSAAYHFEQIKSYRSAAQCYYTCKDYEKAAELFEINDQPLQCAECLRTIGQLEKAAKIYEEHGVYLRAFECYEELDWESLILCLSRNKDKFNTSERDNLINMYLPKALSGIYQQLTENTEGNEHRTKNIEQKYKNANAIAEESDFSSDEEGYQDQNEEEIKDKQQDDDKQQTVDEHSNDDEEIIDTSTYTKQEERENSLKIDNKEESKHDTSGISDFTLLSKAELAHNFDHLSNFDPEDDFLKSENSYSIIGSVLCKDEETLSEYSDVSIISGSRVNLIRGGNVIQSSIDYFAHDKVIQKIVFYLSLFSDDLKKCLDQQRSKSERVTIDENEDGLDFFELELDNLNEELVSTTLDMLEHFDLFRLCLVLCNKYNLKNHISRYLTSTCYKYSNLKLLGMSKILSINSKAFRNSQKQVSVLANEAIHNILKIIDPSTILQQCTEDLTKESTLLGGESWRYIYYLGFWKKLIYLMDTHNALKLGYSARAFQDFKTVYLINYWAELTDEQIKSKIDGSDPMWIKEDNTALIEYLCRKVALEESTHSLNNDNLHPEILCNRNLNLSLKSLSEGNKSEAITFMIDALRSSQKKFSQLLRSRDKIGSCLNETDRYSPEYYDNKQLFIGRLLPLFDIFMLYGRIFSDQEVRNILKETFNDNPDIFFTCIKMSKFCIGLVDNLTNVISSFSPLEITAILQGLLAPLNVRIPEASDLMLNSNIVCHMNRKSQFHRQLEKYISMVKNDRNSKDYYVKVEEIVDNNSSIELIKTSVVDRIAANKTNLVTKSHDYLRLTVADIEAEYISCPLYVILFWYKKLFVSFVSQTVVQESLMEFPSYNFNEMFSNENYNEDMLPQTVKDVYKLSLEVCAGLLNIQYTHNLGCVTRSKIYEEQFQRELYPQQWISKFINKLKYNVDRMNRIAKINGVIFRGYAPLKHGEYYVIKTIDGKTLSENNPKQQQSELETLYKKSFVNLTLFESLHNLPTDRYSGKAFGIEEHDFLLQRAFDLLDQFLNIDIVEEDGFDTNQEYKFRTLITMVDILSKSQRFDILKKYSKLKCLRDTFKNDPFKMDLIDRVQGLIKAIELYQCDQWEKSIQEYMEFMNHNTKILKEVQWLRMFEKTWYLAIVTFWADQGSIYLPVNALNYLHEDVEVIENEQEHEERYLKILNYEKWINLPQSQNKDPLGFFIAMLKNFETMANRFFENTSIHYQKIMIAMFNMFGTLIINCDKVSTSLCDAIGFYQDIINEGIIDQNNSSKFEEYFHDIESCQQFKADFSEIVDYEKNDTLYHEGTKDNNQYLVMLTIREEENKTENSIDLKYSQYLHEDAQRILSTRTLIKKLKLPIKNFNLSLKSTSHIKRSDCVSPTTFNWMLLAGNVSAHEDLKAIHGSFAIEYLIDKFYNLQNQLFNILHNHYTIRNSLDTHFVVTKLDEIEKILVEARLELSYRSAENSKLDESSSSSFNPFIEIGSNTEELKFVSPDSPSHLSKPTLSQIISTLNSKYTSLSTSLTQWLQSLPPPTLQSITTQHTTLTNKLRWESLISSRTNLQRLQAIYKKIRNKS
ncbi:unnamed protein product [Moneuplotes crassus]|uniref:UvrD-like helicase ATP-binding domain-containing protein n=2 Tax=Euplotes crassus TaxID=5936 RepID=A0AAD1Y461_EUPCR|nr:unnamed protein product [Moneuplotes crassus]